MKLRTPDVVAAEIRRWNQADVHELRDLLVELRQLDEDVQGWLDMSSLPSAPIPPDIDTGYPVWAVDKHGRALVGPSADAIEHVDSIRAFQRESGRTTG